MCKDEKEASPMPAFGWEEIRKHTTKTDRWLVIDGCVYNVTRWAKKHPGGERLIAHHSGQDATVSKPVFIIWGREGGGCDGGWGGCEAGAI